jgi:hypothetical protein
LDDLLSGHALLHVSAYDRPDGCFVQREHLLWRRGWADTSVHPVMRTSQAKKVPVRLAGYKKVTCYPKENKLHTQLISNSVANVQPFKTPARTKPVGRTVFYDGSMTNW